MSINLNRFSRRIFLGLSAALAAASGLSTSAAAKNSTVPSSVISDASVSLIADALRKIGQDPMKLAMTTDIKPLVNVGRTIIGPAVTCKWEVARSSKGSADDIRRYIFRPLDNAAPGSMWVIASGTEQILSMLGDVIARVCLRNGFVGAITDNGCRDIEAMKAIGFPVFGKASVPYGPGNILRAVAANEPVICGKVEVNPNDLVAADSDGVIVIPRAVIAELKESIKKEAQHENDMRKKIDAGGSLEKIHSL